MSEMMGTNQNTEEVQKESIAPVEQTSVPLKVSFDLKHKAVVIHIGVKSLNMSIQGARDFALALRQAANLVEKKA